jgi:hypothetical protein
MLIALLFMPDVRLGCTPTGQSDGRSVAVFHYGSEGNSSHGATAAQPSSIDVDEPDTAEGIELRGADVSGEVLNIAVVPVQADEFTCASCFLVLHRSQFAKEFNGLKFAPNARDKQPVPVIPINCSAADLNLSTPVRFRPSHCRLVTADGEFTLFTAVRPASSVIMPAASKRVRREVETRPVFHHSF